MKPEVVIYFVLAYVAILGLILAASHAGVLS